MTGLDVAPGSVADAAEIALAGSLERAAEFATNSIAESTRRAYESDWARFAAWAADRGVAPLPAEPAAVAAYIAEAASSMGKDGKPEYAPSTLSRWAAAINHYHRQHGLASPTGHPQVRAVLKGARRALAQQRRVRRMAPVLKDSLDVALEAMCDKTWPGAVFDLRDRLVLLMGWAGAFRRGELAALTAGDIAFEPGYGLSVIVRKSKTDQEARGQIKAFPLGTTPQTCVACAWWRWSRILGASRDRADMMRVALGPEREGRHVHDRPPTPLAPDVPVFQGISPAGALMGTMTAQNVAWITKRRLAVAGLDPAVLGGHSLRAGFVTEAVRNGATTHEVMRQTGHSSEATVAVYIREHDPLQGNAVTKIGL